MKGSFIIAFLLMECIALVQSSAVQAQYIRPQRAVMKNNFTGFTRKYTNRGKLWMARNKAYLSHQDANFVDGYNPNSKAVELFEKRTIDSKFYINKDTPSIFYSQRSSNPMHFKKNGEWITIDTRLSPKGPCSMKLPVRKIRWVLILKENHPISLLRMVGLISTIGNCMEKTGPPELCWPPPIGHIIQPEMTGSQLKIFFRVSTQK